MPFVESAGVRLYYEAVGQGDPIVFAHESAADTRQWSGQIEALAPHYRCISYNARGYPPSDVPVEDTAYGYVAAWQDLATVVSSVAGGPAHVVGLSMGAYAALMLGMNRPDLVRSLVLAGCGTGSVRVPDGRLRAAMAGLADLIERDGMAAGAKAIASPPNRTGLRARAQASWQQWFDDLLSHSPEGMARTFRNYQGNRPSLYDFEAELSRLQRPTLLVAGDEDTGCFEINMFLRETIAGSALCIVPHSGHAVNIDAPALFNYLVADFLAQSSDAAPRNWPGSLA